MRPGLGAGTFPRPPEGRGPGQPRVQRRVWIRKSPPPGDPGEGEEAGGADSAHPMGVHTWACRATVWCPPLCADVGTVQKPRASGSNPGFTCVSCAAMRPPSEVDRRGQARRGPWWGSVSRRRGLAPAGLGSLPCCLQAGLPGEEGGPPEALVSVQCHVRGRSSTRSCSCYSQMPVLSNAWANPQPSSFSG